MVEKAPPQATGFDGIIRPLLVSPAPLMSTSGDRLSGPPPHPGPRGSGRDRSRRGPGAGLPGGRDRGGAPCDPRLADRPLPAGRPPALRGADHRAKLSNGEDGLLAEYVRIRDLDANAAGFPPASPGRGPVMAADMLNTGLYGAQLADVQPGDTVVVMAWGLWGLWPLPGQSSGGRDASWPSAAGQPGWHWPSSTGPPTWSTTKRGTSPGKSTCSPTSRAPTAASVPAAVPTPWGRLSPWSAGAAPWAM